MRTRVHLRGHLRAGAPESVRACALVRSWMGGWLIESVIVVSHAGINQKAIYSGSEQPRIGTSVLGHSLVHLLFRLHCSLICFLSPTCFPSVFHCAHWFARLLTHLLPSRKVNDSMSHNDLVLSHSVSASRFRFPISVSMATKKKGKKKEKKMRKYVRVCGYAAIPASVTTALQHYYTISLNR